jgi:hypothetical protein
MENDPLKSLLKDADAHLPARTAAPRDLANRVRAIYRRRQWRKWTTLCVSVALTATWSWRHQLAKHDQQLAQHVEVTPTTQPIAASQEDLLRAVAEVGRDEQFLEQLLAAEQRVVLAADSQALLIDIDGQFLSDEHIGRAALSLLLAADQKRARPGLQESAGRDYATVINLFPSTAWAELAQQRLLAPQP